MEEKLLSGLLTVCGLLQKHGVKYLVVGGAAVALNGYFRQSVDATGALVERPDVDIWYDPTYENYFNLLKVMKELGQEVLAFEKEQIPNPHQSFFKLSFSDFTLDLLPQIKANFKFYEAERQKNTVEIEGIPIYSLSIADLIEDKQATARHKDLEDIEMLKKRRDEEA